jgi:hypothetical protein
MSIYVGWLSVDGEVGLDLVVPLHILSAPQNQEDGLKVLTVRQ